MRSQKNIKLTTRPNSRETKKTTVHEKHEQTLPSLLLPLEKKRKELLDRQLSLSQELLSKLET
jgi:hypothetical protein